MELASWPQLCGLRPGLILVEVGGLQSPTLIKQARIGLAFRKNGSNTKLHAVPSVYHWVEKTSNKAGEHLWLIFAIRVKVVFLRENEFLQNVSDIDIFLRESVRKEIEICIVEAKRVMS